MYLSIGLSEMRVLRRRNRKMAQSKDVLLAYYEPKEKPEDIRPVVRNPDIKKALLEIVAESQKLSAKRISDQIKAIQKFEPIH